MIPPAAGGYSQDKHKWNCSSPQPTHPCAFLLPPLLPPLTLKSQPMPVCWAAPEFQN